MANYLFRQEPNSSSILCRDTVQPQEPQQAVDEFWRKLHSRNPGHVRQILRDQAYEQLPADALDGTYNVRKVQGIVRQCRERNEMFTDPEFDIETDFHRPQSHHDCLRSLQPSRYDVTFTVTSDPPAKPSAAGQAPGSVQSPALADTASNSSSHLGQRLGAQSAISPSALKPKSVHRVGWIFDNPTFAIGAKGESRTTENLPSSKDKVPDMSRSSSVSIHSLQPMLGSFPNWPTTARPLLEEDSSPTTDITRAIQVGFFLVVALLLAAPGLDSIFLEFSGTRGMHLSDWFRRSCTLTVATFFSGCSWILMLCVQLLVLLQQSLASGLGETALGSALSIPFGLLIAWTSCRLLWTAFRKTRRYAVPAKHGLDFAASEVLQGSLGNCWLISGIATLHSRNDLFQRVCVAYNQQCGVYGFMFYRDGEWIHTVVDDYLYLKHPDFDNSESTVPPQPSGKDVEWYKQGYQTGSRALYFASCGTLDHYWMALLEKAYAKVHGDYTALWRGWTNEAIEDMTGGVAYEVRTDSVLDTERLWRELRQVSGDYVFGVTTPFEPGNDRDDLDSGLVTYHAYSVLEVMERTERSWKFWKPCTKVRLLKIRNPWGWKTRSSGGVWKGPWSDGSRQWTPSRMKALKRRFKADGTFIITLEDMLASFQRIERTRLFDDAEWTIKQVWASVSVPWHGEYNSTYFTVSLQKPSEVVFVLAQLDPRYFIGLQGRYDFVLNFLVRREGACESDFVVRTSGPRNAWNNGTRSISAETELEAGAYTVFLKVTANYRREDYQPKGTGIFSTEDAIRLEAFRRPRKVEQIARNYDIAHRKLVDHSARNGASSREAEGDESGIDKHKCDDNACASDNSGNPGENTNHQHEDPPNQISNGKAVSDLKDSPDRASGETVIGDPKKSPNQGSSEIYTHPEHAAWNAVCGVGLRVYCKDEKVQIALHRH